MTPTEILRRHTSRELTEWLAFYRLDPFDNTRGDIQAGVIASTMANMWSSKGKSQPSDFIPDFRKKSKSQGWKEQKKVVEMLNAAFGGQVKE